MSGIEGLRDGGSRGKGGRVRRRSDPTQMYGDTPTLLQRQCRALSAKACLLVVTSIGREESMAWAGYAAFSTRSIAAIAHNVAHVADGISGLKMLCGRRKSSRSPLMRMQHALTTLSCPPTTKLLPVIPCRHAPSRDMCSVMWWH